MGGSSVFGFHERGGHGIIDYDHVPGCPASNLLGEEGSGFAIAQARLGPGRIHHCMRLIGMAERAFDVMCRRAVERVAFGRALAEQGVIQDWVAEARIRIEEARLMVLKTAWLVDTQGAKGARIEVGAIKVAVPRMAVWVIDRAIQTLGGAGVAGGFPVAALYAHARSLQIADGPDEVHKRSIARRELRRYLPAGLRATGGPGPRRETKRTISPSTSARLVSLTSSWRAPGKTRTTRSAVGKRQAASSEVRYHTNGSACPCRNSTGMLETADLGVEAVEGHHLGFQQGALVAVPVDQGVGAVLPHRLGVAAHPRPVGGRVGHRRLLQDLAGPAPVADDGPHEDQAGHLLGVALGVARGEQAPHGVPGEDHRQAGVLGGGDAGQRGQVVHDVLEVGDQGPLAVAVPVAQVVLGVHRRSRRRQDLGHVGVAGGVLGVPVDDDHDAVRRGGRLPRPVEDPALTAGEGGFPAVHVASCG